MFLSVSVDPKQNIPPPPFESELSFIIRSSKLAILSNSTFSWWASFLSTSKKEFLVPSNFSTKEKRIILPNETIIN